MKKLNKTITIFQNFACTKKERLDFVTDNVPKVGTETEVYMGDRMVEQRSGNFINCIILIFCDHKWGNYKNIVLRRARCNCMFTETRGCICGLSTT